MKGPIYRDNRTGELTKSKPERGVLIVREGDTAPKYIADQVKAPPTNDKKD